MLVEEYDGSTRLLRDSESRARAEFEWGYGGGGPTTLAEVLTTDALGDLVLCPACLGGAAYTPNLVHCRECTETGLAPQLLELQLSIAEKVETLPATANQRSGRQPFGPGHAARFSNMRYGISNELIRTHQLGTRRV